MRQVGSSSRWWSLAPPCRAAYLVCVLHLMCHWYAATIGTPTSCAYCTPHTVMGVHSLGSDIINVSGVYVDTFFFWIS